MVCTIEVDPRWQQALPGVETCSHLIVLYWMDRARRDLAVQVPKQYGDGKPTFSLRSPVRPNPIALAVVELRKVEGNRLHVVGVDCLDNTPLLDIKPYFASTDSIPDARVGWHADRKVRADYFELNSPFVPAEAGTQHLPKNWVPASAGTNGVCLTR